MARLDQPDATAAEIMPEDPDRPSKADQSTNPKEGEEAPGHGVISKAPQTRAVNEVGVALPSWRRVEKTRPVAHSTRREILHQPQSIEFPYPIRRGGRGSTLPPTPGQARSAMKG